MQPPLADSARNELQSLSDTTCVIAFHTRRTRMPRYRASTHRRKHDARRRRAPYSRRPAPGHTPIETAHHPCTKQTTRRSPTNLRTSRTRRHNRHPLQRHTKRIPHSSCTLHHLQPVHAYLPAAMHASMRAAMQGGPETAISDSKTAHSRSIGSATLLITDGFVHEILCGGPTFTVRAYERCILSAQLSS